MNKFYIFKTSAGTRLNEECRLTIICGERDMTDGHINVGICFLDTSVGIINLCQFEDNKDLNCLETILAFYPPSEILYNRSTKAIFDDLLNKFSSISRRPLVFPESGKALKMLHDYYGSKSEWPNQMLNYIDESDSLGLTANRNSDMVMTAFGGMLIYLRQAMIDYQILNQRKINNLEPPLVSTKLTVQEVPKGKHMILDVKTLRHLDIIPNSGKLTD